MSDEDGHGVFVFNPLPWERELSGRISPFVADPRGEPGDEISARHYQDRAVTSERYWLPPTTVPGYGYTVVEQDDITEFVRADEAFEERAVVETPRHRLTFDRERGGIVSWYDKALSCEWVNEDADYPLAGYVHEQVTDRDHDNPRNLLYKLPDDADGSGLIGGLLDGSSGWRSDWHAVRQGANEVIRHRVYETPVGYEIHQEIEAPGVASPIELVISVPGGGDTVVIEASWQMTQEIHPESTYLSFPFALDDPQAHVDVGNQAMRPGIDQLDGSCHDYYVAQRWVDLSEEDHGMTVSCPINPMVQFGDFSFGDNASDFSLGNGHFLGWITNNYWETNWPANQPGYVHARYHLTPHDAFDETETHRAGREAEHWQPLVQTLAEETASDAGFPTSGSLLNLPAPPVTVVQLKPDGTEHSLYPFVESDVDAETTDGAMQLVIQNSTDEPTIATIGSGVLSITEAESLDLLGGDGNTELSVEDDSVSIDLGPRELSRLRLTCQWNN